jgi:hypothetical protein
LIADALIVSPACGQIPEGWEIIQITSDPEFVDGPPDINDRGQIVFARRPWPDLAGMEIFLYDRGKLVQLTDDDVQDAAPRINNHGEIVWWRRIHGSDKPTGIVMWRNGKVHIVSDQPFSEGSPDINDSGHLVWYGLVDPGMARTELFLFDGSRTRQLTNNGLVNQGAMINNRSDLVWTKYDHSVSPWVSEVIGYFQQSLMLLANGQRQVIAGGLNDVPQVVWDSPFTGVELWENGQTRVLLPENAIAGAINNRGDVAITRWDTVHSNTALWVLRADASFLQIADGSLGGTTPEMNQRGELVWRSGDVTSFPPIGIALLTKRAFIADLDLDGDVDLKDVSMFQMCFGSNASATEENCTSCDMNNDGNVSLTDFDILVGFFGGPE